MVKLLPGDNSKIARKDVSRPLILTLDIEPKAQQYFDGLRNADEAKFLQKTLSEIFGSFSFTTSGLKLWRYLGGPSEFVSYFAFKQ